MPHADFLLIDISNTFTKLAFARGDALKVMPRIPTADLVRSRVRTVLKKWSFDRVVVSSVVPDCNAELGACFTQPIHWVGHRSGLGVKIDYPRPATIGADRLANAAGCAARYGCPAIVVDFGTAVTFDVLSKDGAYVGGVIAPGLSAMTHYLYERTALLPRIQLRKPGRAVGRSTREAMLSGAIFGYRGLVREICTAVNGEISPRRHVPWIATGGDAEMIGEDTKLFDAVDPDLTLQGLLQIGRLNPVLGAEH